MTDTIEVPEAQDDARADGGNAVGIAAFVTGCLALGPVAILLGGVGLARWRSGRASRRSWALAGLVLGVIGTIAVAAGWYAYETSSARQEVADAHAQVDAINVGNAVVDHYEAQPGDTSDSVAVTDSGYLVWGADVATSAGASLTRALTFEGTTAFDWCLTVTLAGEGLEPAVASYAAAAGLVDACPAG